MKKYLPPHLSAWIMIILVWISLSYTLYFYQINTQLADTTFIAQILENFRHSLVMNTSMGVSIIESMDPIWGKSAEHVCSLPLTTHFTVMPWFHYYFALYLLLPFIWISNIPVLLAAVQAGIYLSVLVFAYFYARSQDLSRVNAIIMTLLVAQHPLWIEGIYGQFYVNRLFLPFSALFIWLLLRKKTNYIALGIAGLLAASTNEIYGIGIATILASHLWMKQVINRRLLLLGGVFLAYSFISVALIQHNLGLSLPQTEFISKTTGGGLEATFARLAQDLLSQKTQIFLWVNFASLGILALLARRAIVPVFLILLPNLFINIGGAEKTGWSTHYHMSYFVPLIWLSILGISRLNGRRRLQSVSLLGLLTLGIWINPYTGNLRQIPVFSPRDLYQKARTYQAVSPIYLNFRARLEAAVGSGQSVSLLEPLSYHLYQHETYYYPHNLESVDNVILRYDKNKEGDARFSSISYGKQFAPDMDACIFERMKKDGYDLANPIIVDNWAVIKRHN